MATYVRGFSYLVRVLLDAEPFEACSLQGYKLCSLCSWTYPWRSCHRQVYSS